MSFDEKFQKLGEMLTDMRDAFRECAEAIDGFLTYLSQLMEPTAVKEEAFSILKWEPAKGSRLGDFEVAAKASNLPDRWAHAYNILRQSNATISFRYHGEGYAYSYWLYGEDRIYRQKLKQGG